MKSPSHCPCCRELLLNEYKYSAHDGHIIIRSCKNKIDHAFACTAKESEPEKIITIGIELNKNALIRASWILGTQKLFITHGNLNKEYIIEEVPFFEPDFSNYKKLVNKVKTYVIFS